MPSTQGWHNIKTLDEVQDNNNMKEREREREKEPNLIYIITLAVIGNKAQWKNSVHNNNLYNLYYTYNNL